MNVLIISSCTQSKMKSVPVSFTSCQELLVDQWRDWTREQENADKILMAKDMYMGRGFQTIIRSVQKLRSLVQVDQFIFSAGLGLVEEHEYIPNYECTFTTMKKAERGARVAHLKINELILKLLNRNSYHLILILLGKTYLEGIYGSLQRLSKEFVVVVAKDTQLDAYASLIQIPTDVSVISQLKEHNLPAEAVTNLKGHLFSLFVECWLLHPKIMSQAIQNQDANQIQRYFEPAYVAQMLNMQIVDEKKSQRISAFFSK